MQGIGGVVKGWIITVFLIGLTSIGHAEPATPGLADLAAEENPGTRHVAYDHEEGMAVSAITALVTERTADDVVYTVTVDVANKGERGAVSIKLIGKNRDGDEVTSVSLNGTLDRGVSKTLTATTMVTNKKASDIISWEVGEVRKFPPSFYSLPYPWDPAPP